MRVQVANTQAVAVTSGNWTAGQGVSYMRPVITAVYGDGTNKGPTSGGATFFIEVGLLPAL